MSARKATFLFLLLFSLFLIGGWLLNNVVLVSAIQHHKSVTGIHKFPPFLSLPPAPHPPTSLGHHRASSRCSTAASHRLSISHVVVRIYQYYSLNLSHPLFPPPCPKGHSLCPCLCCCTANRFIRSNFLSSVQFSSVTQLCVTICDPMDCSMPILPVQHQFLEFT